MHAQLANALLGIWLMAAPTVLSYGDPARGNDRIVGPIVAAVAWIAVSEVTRSVRRVNYLTGAWLLVAPLVLGYGLTPTVNGVVVGLLVIALAGAHGTVTQRFGGGWAVLRPPPGPGSERRHAE